MLTCSGCGRRVSSDLVNMFDYCPGCQAAPFEALDDEPPC